MNICVCVVGGVVMELTRCVGAVMGDMMSLVRDGRGDGVLIFEVLVRL